MNPTAPSYKTLCIFFCDIVDSTRAYAEAKEHGQDAAHTDMLIRFRSNWEGLLKTQGAAFTKFTGDGLMATFPSTLDALKALVEAGKTLKTDPDLQALSLRMGLHTGRVTEMWDGDLVAYDVTFAQRLMDQALAGEIVVSEAFRTQAQPHLPEDCRIEALNEAILKGFPDPVQIYRLCLSELPATSAHRAASSSSGALLLLSPDHFIGRKTEIAALNKYLQQGERRCVTITATAGCGKTRIMLQFASMIERSFAGEIVFVPLEEATDADGVLSRIAAALKLYIGPNQQVLPALRERLSGRSALLLLDNFEQVIEAAPVVAALLDALPLLRIFITTREPLRLRHEQVFELEPLEVPPEEADLQAIERAESVRLFIDRAAAALQGFALDRHNAADIAALCRMASGLPLTIEILAAEMRFRPLSRLKELGSEFLDIQSGIRDVPERQKSVRAAYEWSYRLLTPAEQQLFVQLSLFETSFGESEIEEVCTGAAPMRDLRRLCEKTFVSPNRRDGSRPYTLLVPAREYARTYLASRDPALRRRFIAAFTRRAERLRTDYYNNLEFQALSGIERDLPNFRAAWGMACQDQNSAEIADLGMAVTFFTPFLSRTAGIEGWMDEVENALVKLNDLPRLASLYNCRARLANIRGDYRTAVVHQKQALRCCNVLNDLNKLADVHSTLAFFALRAQDLQTAEKHAEEGRELARKMAQAGAEAMSLYVLSCLNAQRDPVRANKMAQRSFDLFEELKQCRGMAHACSALASIAEQTGDTARAEQCYKKAVLLSWSQRAVLVVVRYLEELGRFYGQHNDQERADYLLLAASAAQRELGIKQTAHDWLSPEAARSAPTQQAASLAEVIEKLLPEAGSS